MENSLEKFLEVFIDTLVIFASCKKKYSRGNNMPFMNKFLLSANMKKKKRKKTVKELIFLEQNWH